MLISRGEAITGIYHEKNHVSRAHSNVSLDRYLSVKSVVQLHSDTTGVDDVAWDVGYFTRGSDAVTCDTGFIVDDCNTTFGESIEDRGFTYVWAAYDGDGWCFQSMKECEVGSLK